jgi:hypothetical protein
VRRRLNKACGTGIVLPPIHPGMTTKQRQAAAGQALANISQTGSTVLRLAKGHPTTSLIGLALSYREIGGLYVSFQTPQKSKAKFNAALGQLHSAVANAKKQAANAGIRNCGPR